MYLGRCVPIARHVSIQSTIGFFRRFITKIRNRTLVLTSWAPSSGSIHYVGSDICIWFIVIRPYSDVMMTTTDSVSAWKIMHFATWIVAWSFCSSIRALCDSIVVNLNSLPVRTTNPGNECTCTIWCSIKHIPWIGLNPKIFDLVLHV